MTTMIWCASVGQVYLHVTCGTSIMIVWWGLKKEGEPHPACGPVASPFGRFIYGLCRLLPSSGQRPLAMSATSCGRGEAEPHPSDMMITLTPSFHLRMCLHCKHGTRGKEEGDLPFGSVHCRLDSAVVVTCLLSLCLCIFAPIAVAIFRFRRMYVCMYAGAVYSMRCEK